MSFCSFVPQDVAVPHVLMAKVLFKVLTVGVGNMFWG